MKDFIKFIILFVIGICLLGYGLYNLSLTCKKAYEKDIKIQYEKGYKDACIEFYKNNFIICGVSKADGTEFHELFGKNYIKRRDVVSYELNAWDDKNYFEGNKILVIEQLNRWNSEDYYEVKRLSCPKCNSYRIMPDHNRDRGVIMGYKCKDCGYIWKRP